MKQSLKPKEKTFFVGMYKTILLEKSWEQKSGNIFHKSFPFYLNEDKYIMPLELEITSRIIKVHLILPNDARKIVFKAFHKAFIEDINANYGFLMCFVPTVFKTGSEVNSKVRLVKIKRGITPPPIIG